MTIDMIDTEPLDEANRYREVVVPGASGHVTAVGRIGGLGYLADFARLADAVHKTEMVPESLRGRPDAVLAVFMAGFEIGIGPMQALQGINMIKGKPSISPELMRALITQAGHRVIVEAANDKATIRCHRKEWPEDQWSDFTWTLEDARIAGLLRTNDGTWSKYPRAMLTARVTSEAARAVFPDVIAGLSYTADEVEEFAPVPAGLSTPGEVPVIEVDAPELPAEASTPVSEMPAGDSPGITQRHVNKIRQLLARQEITTDLDVALVVSRYIGRDVDSVHELTEAEAVVVIEKAAK